MSQAGRSSAHGAIWGYWQLDLLNNELRWSDEIYRIFESTGSQLSATYEAFLDCIHPEDRAAVNKAYTDSLKAHTAYRIEHRLLMKDGRSICAGEV